MSALRDAARQALEALEFLADEWGFTHKANRPERWRAIEALRAALAQQAEPVEPVAWQCREHGDFEWFDCGKESYGINPRRYTYRTLYTAPPQRKPLMQEEIDKIFKHLCNTVGASYETMARAVERAHGIKE